MPALSLARSRFPLSPLSPQAGVRRRLQFKSAIPVTGIGVIALTLSVASALGYECAPPEDRDGWHRSAELQSPTSRHAAWGENSGNGVDVPFRGRIFLRDHRATASRIILDLGQKQANLPHCCDLLCVVDWSRDGRYLLVEGSGGLVTLDAVTYQPWVYNLRRMRLQPIPLKHLRTHVEAYSSAGNRYRLWPYLHAIGWEPSRSARIVLRAYGLGAGDVVELGVWSIGLDGANARLLDKDPTGVAMMRFGKIRDAGPVR